MFVENVDFRRRCICIFNNFIGNLTRFARWLYSFESHRTNIPSTHRHYESIQAKYIDSIELSSNFMSYWAFKATLKILRHSHLSLPYRSECITIDEKINKNMKLKKSARERKVTNIITNSIIVCCILIVSTPPAKTITCSPNILKYFIKWLIIAS